MNERQAVTGGMFVLTVLLLAMAWHDPALWNVKLFEVILQAVVLTGLLNMVGAFHFAANKGGETARQNTSLAFKAITATANATNSTGGAVAGAETATESAEVET